MLSSSLITTFSYTTSNSSRMNNKLTGLSLCTCPKCFKKNENGVLVFDRVYKNHKSKMENARLANESASTESDDAMVRKRLRSLFEEGARFGEGIYIAVWIMSYHSALNFTRFDKDRGNRVIGESSSSRQRTITSNLSISSSEGRYHNSFLNLKMYHRLNILYQSIAMRENHLPPQRLQKYLLL